MIRDEIRSGVLDVLGEIAPETDLASIKPDIPFRDQIDLDSMDYLNFVIALDEKFAAGIPEREYASLTTLNACVEKLESLLVNRNASKSTAD
jgi:acyl carrier protein